MYVAIATLWLGFPEPEVNTAYSVYCPDHLDLDDYDIDFAFQGEDGSPVHFRCQASRLLKSPFRHPSDCGFELPIEVGDVDNPGTDWFLGQVKFQSRLPVRRL